MLKNNKNKMTSFLYLFICKLINKENTLNIKIPVGNIRFLLDICKLATQENFSSINGAINTKIQDNKYIPAKIDITFISIFLFGYFKNVSNPNPESILNEKQKTNIILVGTAVETKGIWKKYTTLAKKVSKVKKRPAIAENAKNQK